MSARSLFADPRRMGRLIKKELSESLRDRRTILTLVLMPLLLYPLLTLAFGQLMIWNKMETEELSYRLAFASREDADRCRDYWNLGREHLVFRHTGAVTRDQAEDLTGFLKPMPKLVPFLTEDPIQAVRKGLVDAAVRVGPSKFKLAAPIGKEKVGQPGLDIQVVYRKGSILGREVARHIDQLLADTNSRLYGPLFEKEDKLVHGGPFWCSAAEVTDEAGSKPYLVLIPLILILMTMTGAVYPAIDLTAGERERGTLEILVAAPLPRLGVLLAKYIAVFTVAMLTATINLGTMLATLQVTKLGPALFGANLTLLVLVLVFGLLILFAAFFSAVALALTSFARSFKEAQAYLIPLMLLCLAPGILALLPGLSLSGPLAVVPLINIVLLSRDLLEGLANPGLALIVVATTLLYALAALAVAARLFGTEAVLSSESSGWGDFLRRPEEPQPAATTSAALLCLAVLFPCYFFSSTALGGLEGLDLATRLTLSAVLNIVLFLGFPGIAAWFGRVRLDSGFGLRSPGVAGTLIAVLLGVSLLPFVHELTLILRQVGFTTLRPEMLERLRGLLEQWRLLSPALLLVCLALLPALVEEWFFRGYLLRAFLQNGRAWPAILASAALFSLFHLLVNNSLAIERLLPSFLLGVVLGWLAVASGSVVPGMILHTLHNGLLVTLALAEPWLKEQGWNIAAEEHLPVAVLASAGVVALLGLGSLAALARRNTPRA